MNTVVNPKAVTGRLNKCYLDWNPEYPNHIGATMMNSFKYYIERTAGLRVYFVEE